MDDRMAIREGVAKEHGIALYRQYGEQQAAAFLGWDYSTLKRNRKKGNVPFIAHGEGVRYLGIQLVDYLIHGKEAVKLWGGVKQPEEISD